MAPSPLGSHRCNLSRPFLLLRRAALPNLGDGHRDPGRDPGRRDPGSGAAGGWVCWAPREPVIFRGWGRVANCCSRAGNARSSSLSQISCRPDPACFPSPAACEHRALRPSRRPGQRGLPGTGQAGQGVRRAEARGAGRCLLHGQPRCPQNG